jgi:hypothetical protein
MAKRRTIRRTSSSSRKSTSGASTGSRSTRGSSSSRSTSRRGASQRKQPSAPLLDISAALRLEILGIAFLAMAVLTFLSLISPSQGRLTNQWLFWLRQGFGWGAYVMPFVFGAVGLGLLMHGFGRLPPLRGERVIGLTLMFLMALGLSHLAATAADPWTVVTEGRAGGLLGWTVGRGMLSAA